MTNFDDMKNTNRNGKTAGNGKSKSDYEGGYGKPPKQQRFKKGQSGNPKGRPKGSKNMATLFAEVLDSNVTVSVNGTKRNLPYREAIVKQMAARGLTGSMNDIVKVLNTIDKHLPDELKSADIPHELRIRFIESDGNGGPANPADLEPITDFSKVKMHGTLPEPRSSTDTTECETNCNEVEDAWKASGIDEEPET